MSALLGRYNTESIIERNHKVLERDRLDFEERKRRMMEDLCFHCGSGEHMGRECPQRPGDRQQHRRCNLCGSKDHLNIQCPVQRWRRENKLCHGCCSSGHKRGECSETDRAHRRARDLCFECGAYEHWVAGCHVKAGQDSDVGVRDPRFWQWYWISQFRKTPEFGEQMMRYFLGLSMDGDSHVPSYPSEDVVFVTIDTEGAEYVMSEIGISTLDTRDLAAEIRTFNFRLPGRQRYSSRRRHFLFGETEPLERMMLPSLMEKLLRTGSLDTNQNEERKVVLIGHSLIEDLKKFRDQRVGGWDWRENWSNLPTLDTVFLEAATRRPWVIDRPHLDSAKLTNILDVFDVEHDEAHCAGNDANYTMKAALILAINSGNKAPITEQQQMRKKILEDVVRVALPPRPLMVKEEKEVVLDMNLVTQRREMKVRKRIIIEEIESTDAFEDGLNMFD